MESRSIIPRRVGSDKAANVVPIYPQPHGSGLSLMSSVILRFLISVSLISDPEPALIYTSP